MPKEDRIEYVNTTDKVDIFISQTSEHEKDKVIGVKVSPGKSVFLTQEDINRNKRESGAIFSKGLLRKAGLIDKDLLKEINVRDEMSELEIREFVKRSESVSVFGTKLRKLSSTNTLELVLGETKKQNKLYNFIKSVEDRLQKLNDEQEAMIQ